MEGVAQDKTSGRSAATLRTIRENPATGQVRQRFLRTKLAPLKEAAVTYEPHTGAG